MDTNQAIGERLKHIRNERGMSVAAFARLLEEKDHRIRDIESGKQKIPPEIITKLRNILDINPHWLLTGEGEMYAKDTQGSGNDVEVNYYPEVFASAGFGVQNYEIEPQKVRLASFLLKLFKIVNIKRVDLINVIGESMQPYFDNGDIAVIERVDSIEEVKNGETVIANINGDIYIKKIEKIPFEKIIILKSTNQTYPDIVVREEELDALKVVAIVRGKLRGY